MKLVNIMNFVIDFLLNYVFATSSLLPLPALVCGSSGNLFIYLIIWLLLLIDVRLVKNLEIYMTMLLHAFPQGLPFILVDTTASVNWYNCCNPEGLLGYNFFVFSYNSSSIWISRFQIWNIPAHGKSIHRAVYSLATTTEW